MLATILFTVDELVVFVIRFSSIMFVDDEDVDGKEVRSMLDDEQSEELPPQPLLLLVDEEDDFIGVTV